MVITSQDNKTIKNAIKCTDKKYIKQFGVVLVESYKVVSDVSMFCDIEHIFVEEDSVKKYEAFLSKYRDKVMVISSKVAKSMSNVVDSCDIFATIKIPSSKDILGKRVLILDCLQDPSNLGAIARSARATGYNDIMLIDCVYPYSPKVIRSSMGHILGLNIVFSSYQDIEKLKNNGYDIIIADLDGKNAFDYQQNNDKIGLVIGNEGNGISSKAKACATQVLTLPMKNNVESLNASVSASILMYLTTK